MRPTRFTDDMIAAYVSSGYWDDVDIVSIVNKVAQQNPEKEALADSSGKRMTWRELKALSDRLALGLIRFGLRKDDLLVLQLPNNVENVVIRIALLKAGIIGLFPPMTFRGEIPSILSRFRPSAFIGVSSGKFNTLQYVLDGPEDVLKILKGVFHVGESQVPGAIRIDDIVNSIPQDYENSLEALQELERNKCGAFEVAFLGLTSGTTGTPKACEWPTPAVKLYAQTVIERMRLTHEDVMGIIAPLTGGPGITLWLTSLLLGSKTALLEKFDAESALQLIAKERVTAAGLVPAQLIKMSNHPNLARYNLSSLRALRATASLIAREVAAEVEAKMGCKILTAAGSQESMSIGHTHIDDPDVIRIESIGKPWKYNEVKIVGENQEELPSEEEGEIWVRGPCTGSGYFRDVESTIAAWGVLGIEGSYRTGDIGKKDEKGNIAITGRKKNTIKRGGQNIYPEEIEKILSRHSKIIEVVIVPMPDPQMGEKACAFVTLKNKEDSLSLEEVRSFLEQEKIAKFKFPEKVVVLDQFPTVGGGDRVDRRALARKARETDDEQGKAAGV